MKISIYTFVRDGIFFDYHVVPMLRHHLPLADEIIVSEGYSRDDTYERIRDLDPKIRIVREEWKAGSAARNWYAAFKDRARTRCGGDWCILLDCDEFIPEWEFPRLRSFLETTRAAIVPLRYAHFYGNYRVYHMRPELLSWPVVKHCIHRNLPDVEVWGDGSNVRFTRASASSEVSEMPFECHHFGFVRNPARLREKWRIQQRTNERGGAGRSRIPSFVFDLAPHDWKDPQFLEHLALHPGPYVKAVRDDPAEFIRDDLDLYRYLSARDPGPGPGPGAVSTPPPPA